jgi:hypothetical protein
MRGMLRAVTAGVTAGGDPGGYRRRRRVCRYAWPRHDHSLRTSPWRRAVPQLEVIHGGRMRTALPQLRGVSVRHRTAGTRR